MRGFGWLAYTFDDRQVAARAAKRDAFGHYERLLGEPTARRKEHDARHFPRRFECLGDRFRVGFFIVAFRAEIAYVEPRRLLCVLRHDGEPTAVTPTEAPTVSIVDNDPIATGCKVGRQRQEHSRFRPSCGNRIAAGWA